MKKITFFDIPLLVSTWEHPLDPDLFISTSSGGFKGLDGRRYVFTGWCANTDKNHAEKVSAFESLERMLGSKPLFIRENAVQSFEVVDFPKFEQTGKILGLDDVCVRSTVDPDIGISASGLSIHSNYYLSVEHGIREILERDILCRVWYGDKVLQQLSSEQLKDGFEVSFYSTLDELPFCLAVITHKDKPIFFSGSSLACDINVAQNSARNEAFLLLMNLFQNMLNPTAHQGAGSKRLHTLVGATASDMWKHFTNKLSLHRRNKPAGRQSVQTLISQANYKLSDIEIVNVRSFKGLYVTRAFVKGAMTKNESRRKNADVVPDPFC